MSNFEYITSGTGLTPDLDNAYWYDTGTDVNGENVYYDSGGTYAYWNDGSDWLIYTIEDYLIEAGGGASPTDYFKAQWYSDSLVVSGTGTGIDTTLLFNALVDGRPQYMVDPATGVEGEVVWDVAEEDWALLLEGDVLEGETPETWRNPSTSYDVPKELWEAGSAGSPPPAISYTLPTTLQGNGGWSGEIAVTETSYENAVRILKNQNARIAQSDGGIHDDNFVILFWENVEARYINECVRYLNESAQSVVAGPSQFYDVLFSDTLYHLHAYYKEEAASDDKSQRIYRVMMRSPISYAADNWGASTTKWSLYKGRTITHGPNTMLTLYMANVKATEALSFERQSLSESYTDSIYLLDTGLLSGTWYSIQRLAEKDPKTGLYTLYWVLNETENTTLYFTFMQGPNKLRGFMYRRESTQAILDTLFDDTYFKTDGTLDTQDNPELADPRVSWTLGEQPAGRTVINRSTRRDNEDFLWDVDVEIIWEAVEVTKDDVTALADVSSEVPRFGIAYHKQWTEFGSGDQLPSVTLGGFDEDDGLWRVLTAITGLDGGSLKRNDNGYFDWRLHYDYLSVPATDWFIHSVAREWVKKEIPLTASWQQIRRRVGGDLEFNKVNAIDPATGRVLATQVLAGVEWNSAWEWDEASSYSSGWCIFYEGLLYTANTTTTVSEEPTGTTGLTEWDAVGSAPTRWYDYGYSTRYGDWKSYWRKGYSTGTQAIRNNYDAGGTCLAKYSEEAYYNPVSKAVSGMHIDNSDWGNPSGWPVVYLPSEEKFYRLELSTTVAAWGQDTPYSVGDVVTAPARFIASSGTTTSAGLCVYTCVQGHSSTASSSWYTDSEHWSVGIIDQTPSASSVWWHEYDADYLVSKIARAGVGEAPFEEEDVYIPIRQEFAEEVDWNLLWDASENGNGGAEAYPTGMAPDNWVSEGYQDRYGDWLASWVKGYEIGEDSIIGGYDDASTCAGEYADSSYYNPVSVPVSGMHIDNSDWGNPSGWPVVYLPSEEKFYRLELSTTVAAWGQDTPYSVGDVVTAPARFIASSGTTTSAGLCVYTCVQGHSSTASSSWYTDSEHWSVGIIDQTPSASSVWWHEYDADYIRSVIALNGSGVAPFNDAAKVGVINSEGEYVIGANSRVSFYTNPHENPEYFVAGQRLVRFEDTFILRSYFVVDPIYVVNQRIPQTISEMGSDLYHPDDPNIRVQYKTLELRRGELWCVEQTLSRFGEWSADAQTLSSFENNSEVDGEALMDGDSRNFPYVDANGYWSLYHRIPEIGTYTGDEATTGKPTGAFKDVG